MKGGMLHGRNYFTMVFHQKNSLSKGSIRPGYETPEKDYEVTHIPGRNGDIYVDKGSYKNVSRSYDIAIGAENKDFTIMANFISEWLNSASGYAKLEDLI